MSRHQISKSYTRRVIDLLYTILQASINYDLPKNSDGYKFFSKFVSNSYKRKENSNSESTEDFRIVQMKNYSE